MDKLDPKVIIAGAVAAVLFGGFVLFQAFSGNEEEDPVDAGPGPVATLAPAGDGDLIEEPVAEEVEEPAESGLEADVEAAQIDAAEQFIETYYAYSFRDKTPNDFLIRAKPLMTDDFWNSTRDAFKDADPETGVEWSKIRNDRREVGVVESAGSVDPWYDATAKRAVIAVEFTQATTNALGTGGTGDPQTERLMVVNVGGKYLVDEIVVTGTDGT